MCGWVGVWAEKKQLNKNFSNQIDTFDFDKKKKFFSRKHPTICKHQRTQKTG